MKGTADRESTSWHQLRAHSPKACHSPHRAKARSQELQPVLSPMWPEFQTLEPSPAASQSTQEWEVGFWQGSETQP